MLTLDRKLVRDLARLWPQALAIALVMAAGAATLIVGLGAHASLTETRAAYYERNRFADVFVNLTRAPRLVADEVARIPGIATVEPRITKIAMLDLPGVAEPASAMFVSLPDLRPARLNLLHMRSGRAPLPDAESEVVVSETFADAHGFRIGSTFSANLNGRKRSLRIVGTAMSPEFIYAVGPGDLIPDDRRFGIMWLSERALAGAYDLDAAFSNLNVKLLHDASEAAVIERLDAMLARYGGLGAHGRRDQFSHAFLDAELKQLASLSRILPPIFLLVAAFLVNMTLSRMIALEREQIGLLKALGYADLAIGAHYLKFVAIITLLGILIGAAAGTWLGAGMTRLYSDFFHFPFLLFRRDPAVYLLAAGITLAAALFGAIQAVRNVVRLPPAVAMAPPAPARYRRMLPELIYRVVNLPQSLVMVSRHLIRWPGRSLSTLLGIAFSVAILVSSMWAFGSIDYMLDFTYGRADRQDATISFTQERSAAALANVLALPGVLAAEPYRAIPVRIRHGHVERRLSVFGRPQEARLSRVLDVDAVPVRLPSSGIALSEALARILGARVGDRVELELLERNRRIIEVPVAAIIQGFLGLTAHMDLEASNRLVREGAVISGVHIAFDASSREVLFRSLKETPIANSITLQSVSVRKFRETIAQNILIQITVFAAFAGTIAFGVVYNFARISLSEQGRELASLRVLGFTKGEVSGILLSELAVVILLAQPIGWALGYGIAWLVALGFDSELYQVPLVVERNVYAYASLIVIGAAVISGLVVRRRIDRLDLVEVLKTRE
jgi:putative ABC transport system permease protein